MCGTIHTLLYILTNPCFVSAANETATIQRALEKVTHHTTMKMKMTTLVHLFYGRCIRIMVRGHPSTFHSRRMTVPAFTIRTASSGGNVRRLATVNFHDASPEEETRDRRRRRGGIGMRSSQRERRQSAEGVITQHTINDEICPPTDAVTLRKLVHKHVRALPKYWKMKPIAKHNEAAFEEALDFIISRGQSRDESRTKVVLDSGCGTGRSSHLLGERYRDCVVIGIE